MRLFRQATAADEADSRAREAVERVTAVLRSCQRSGITMVQVTDVLSMLGAGPGATERLLRNPLADPMTGAKWAGPPGSTPP